MADFAVKAKLTPSEIFVEEGIHYNSLPMEDLEIMFKTLKNPNASEEEGEELLVWFFKNVVVDENGKTYDNMQTLEDIQKQELFVVQEMMNEFTFLVIPIDKKKF